MSVTVDAVKELAIAAMQAKYGEEAGKAYGFLMFGGFGVPGSVERARLAASANAEAMTSWAPGVGYTEGTRGRRADRFQSTERVI
jgi:hypothetical protein